MSFLYIRLGLKLRTKKFNFSEVKKRRVNEYIICTESSLVSDGNGNKTVVDREWSSPKCPLKKNYSLTDFKDDFSRIYQQQGE